MSSWAASVSSVPAAEAVAKLKANFAKYKSPTPEMQAQFDAALREVKDRLDGQVGLVSISLKGPNPGQPPVAAITM